MKKVKRFRRFGNKKRVNKNDESALTVRMLVSFLKKMKYKDFKDEGKDKKRFLKYSILD